MWGLDGGGRKQRRAGIQKWSLQKSPNREAVYPEVRSGFTMKPTKFVSGSFTFKCPLQGLACSPSGTHGGSSNPSLIYQGSSLSISKGNHRTSIKDALSVQFPAISYSGPSGTTTWCIKPKLQPQRKRTECWLAPAGYGMPRSNLMDISGVGSSGPANCDLEFFPGKKNPLSKVNYRYAITNNWFKNLFCLHVYG